MPKFCANLSFLFTDVPFPERFSRAASAGFGGVEFMSPYEYSEQDVASWLAAGGLELVLFNLPAGDWAAGDRGLACLPERQEEFRASVEQASSYALALNCSRLHCLAGLPGSSLPEALIRDTYVENLRYCADRFAETGRQVMIEPINSRVDMPGYWLDTPSKAFVLLKEIDRPNVRVQLDLYHAQIMAGDLMRTLEKHLPRIGHIQIADNPGRNEPGTGEINYPFIFRRLDELAYEGWVGCEYKPKAGTEEGLAWMAGKY